MPALQMLKRLLDVQGEAVGDLEFAAPCFSLLGLTGAVA